MSGAKFDSALTLDCRMPSNVKVNVDFSVFVDQPSSSTSVPYAVASLVTNTFS